MARWVVKALVTGGYFHGSHEDGEGGDGVVWLVDFATERAEVLLRWSPPPHLRVPTKGFAGGSLALDGTLYVAAHAAVVRVHVGRAAVTGVLHQPCMNDLHHVAVHKRRLYVANTGLCAVDTFDLNGDFQGSFSLLPAWTNAARLGGQDPPPGEPPVRPGWRGDPPKPWPQTPRPSGYYATDRRSAPFHQLKVPDYLHVNHVAPVGSRLLATCFADGSLRNLGSFDVVARFPGSFLHDGVEFRSSLWLTAIDGTVLELDSTTLQEQRRIDASSAGHYGWCRGLAVTEDHLLVGMTEVRAGRLPPHRWADRGPEGSETSVLMLDRRSGRLLARVDLTDAVRHAKLYSILPIGEVPL